MCLLALLCAANVAWASEYYGQVTFGGIAVPGAVVTATRGDKTITVTTDDRGIYRFADLSDGAWKIEIALQCFKPIHAEIEVAGNATPGQFELTLLPADQLKAMATTEANGPAAVLQAERPKEQAPSAIGPLEVPKPTEEDDKSSDGFLVNGSVNNAATSQYSLDRAFGNRRPNSRSLYNGGFALILDNSALDARPYSISGFATPRPLYDRITAGFNFGGPIRIPHVLPRGPNLFFAYQGTRNHAAQTEAALVPTEAERAGDLANAAGQPGTIIDPATGQPFPGSVVPVSAQAQALLQLYPLPNLSGSSLYNFQIPVLDSSHQDVVQTRLDKTLGRRDEVYGNFNLQSTRADDVNLFRFVDTTDTLGINSKINWNHRFNSHLFLFAGYQFSRLRTLVRPEFAHRANISGEAGITGNDQAPDSWGPPALNFSRGIAALTDAESAFNRNRTDGFSGSIGLYRGKHNISVGADMRKQDYNEFFQQDPRGTFTFTGAATGSDLGDFLLGVPSASSIAYGNADKYLRQTVLDAFASDDWRLMPNLTINAGGRWEYGAPMTELHGRLVNLDVRPGFAQVAPVLGSAPVGPLTGEHYPSSLVRPDRLGFEPRIGISWRPFSASTVVVRAGYGIYHDTSVYLSPVLQLAQQAPLSKSVKVENSPGCPLTLANGFTPCATTTEQTFGMDANFQVGYAQTWNLSVQRDLPAALQMTATYAGVKGTHGVQEFLPNSFPLGGVDPCPDCPSGFLYETTGGNSTRHSGQLQLRRRLRAGFMASLLYTWSKSIDDDATLGGQGHTSSTSSSQSDDTLTLSAPPAAQPAQVAQNWLNLKGERSLSSFDQRNLLNVQAQYTSGQGLEGGTLLRGWSGRLLKEWTLLARVDVGSGLPETPVYPVPVPGTGWVGPLRPSVTGAALSSGSRPNASAYAAPVDGTWGTAGRNSITGPHQFSLDSALQRTFRPGGRYYLDARFDATNLLNHAEYTGWNTIVGNAQFGQPVAVNAMRSVETTLRLRF
jgi:hypothetical protein